MRIAKKATVTKLEIISTSTLCDICGKDVDEQARQQRDIYGSWCATDVTIQATIGDAYPEGDFRVCHEVDVCVVCFLAKVVPAIEALGAKFRRCDVDCDSEDRYQRIDIVEDAEGDQ